MHINVDGNLLVGVQFGLVLGFILGLIIMYALMRFVKITREPDLTATREEQRVRGIKEKGPTGDPAETVARLQEGMRMTEDQVDGLIERSKEKIGHLVSTVVHKLKPMLNDCEVKEEDATNGLRDMVRKALIGACLSGESRGVCQATEDDDFPFVVTADFGAEDQAPDTVRIGIGVDVDGIIIHTMATEAKVNA